ncbi:MAG: hypothetical protein ABI297_01850 [Ginsengibacter sp.]
MIKFISVASGILFLSLILNLSSANAQYYYKDLISTAQQNKQFSVLKNEKLHLIKISSFDENDQPSEGFFCEKKINKNFTQSQMLSKSNITGQSLLQTDYNSKGDVIKTTTTTPTTTNTVEFEYNDHGDISTIRTNTTGDGDSAGIIETHEYFYENKKPIKMIRKRNSSVISTITFLTDDKGNIIEEVPSGNSLDKKYFYYYDDNNQLTDIVHYNTIAKRLLPDYMFEYNSDNQSKQMILVEETARNYFIWKYSYNDKKLPEIQKCFSKEKTLLGTIQFDYE